MGWQRAAAFQQDVQQGKRVPEHPYFDSFSADATFSSVRRCRAAEGSLEKKFQKGR